MRDTLSDIGLIMRREIMVRLRQRGFIISFLIVLAAILLGAGLPGLLRSDGPTTYEVGLVGGSGALAAPLRAAAQAADAAADTKTKLDISTFPTVASARAAVRKGTVRVAVAGDEVIVKKEVPVRLSAVLAAAAQSARIQAAVTDGSLRASVAARVTDPTPLRVAAIDPPDSGRDRRLGLTYAATVILYAQIMGFGVWVANGVVEEKSSRVIEVLLSKVPPTSVLAGKIAGIGLLGLAQLVAYLVAGLTVAHLTGSVELPAGWLNAAGGVVLWFLLGFLFYSCAFAVAGSLVSRQEELQNTLGPLTFLLMGSFFLAVAAFGSPGGALATFGSFFPPSAPLVMPLRAAAGVAPAWQVAVSVLVTLVAALAMVRVAARVYAGGALRFGPKLKLREAWGGPDAPTTLAD